RSTQLRRSLLAPPAITPPPPRSLFHAPPPPQLYPLSLHDALPISKRSTAATCSCTIPTILSVPASSASSPRRLTIRTSPRSSSRDRKSTRLNSSHVSISYAVFCLKKKNSRPVSGRQGQSPGRSRVA